MKFMAISHTDMFRVRQQAILVATLFLLLASSAFAAERRPADVWLGKWSGEASYSETERIFEWWFAVSRSCGEYRIQTHSSGPEKVEILNISATGLEFLFHDELGTHIKISLLKSDIYSGTVTQPNNTGLPRGRLDGRKTGEAGPIACEKPELAFLQIEGTGLTPVGPEGLRYGDPFRVEARFDAARDESTVTIDLEWDGGASPRPLQLSRKTGSDSIYLSRPLRMVYDGAPRLVEIPEL